MPVLTTPLYSSRLHQHRLICFVSSGCWDERNALGRELPGLMSDIASLQEVERKLDHETLDSQPVSDISDIPRNLSTPQSLFHEPRVVSPTSSHETICRHHSPTTSHSSAPTSAFTFPDPDSRPRRPTNSPKPPQIPKLSPLLYINQYSP